jgi:hypothetical protein
LPLHSGHQHPVPFGVTVPQFGATGEANHEGSLPEDLRILETVQAGLGKHPAMGQGNAWQIRDEKILGNAGQLAAVQHILASRDAVTAVQGCPARARAPWSRRLRRRFGN